MSEEEILLPNNPVEDLGLLVKAFYKKFGAEALPIIRENFILQGRALARKLLMMLPNTNLSTIGNMFRRDLEVSAHAKIIAISDEKFPRIFSQSQWYQSP